MTENECNILNNMNKIEFREFRSLMIEMVLHTGTYNFNTIDNIREKGIATPRIINIEYLIIQCSD